jgi:hypothetical protein
MNGRR